MQVSAQTHSHGYYQTSVFLDAGMRCQFFATSIPEKFTIVVACFPQRKRKRAAQTFLVASSPSVYHHFCHACKSQLLGLSYSKGGAYTRTRTPENSIHWSHLGGCPVQFLCQYRKIDKNCLGRW